MKRIILHIDFNSFFASVEQQANPFLRGKALAVAGKGKRSIDVARAYASKKRIRVDQADLHRTVVTTASKEAKARGVKTAMSSSEAKRICPDLMIVPGDPVKYSEITKRFLAILRRHTDAVEQFSTDEAFADVTYAAGDYFGAIMLAQIIRDDIKKEIGPYCTASIGIAPNKLAAKLAGESRKPSGLTVVMPEQLASFVAKQDLEAICGIGPRIAKRLEQLGATSTKTLQKLSHDRLVAEFKSYGTFLYNAARGIGDDRVNPTEEAPKSVGHSYTFPFDLDSEAELQTNLLALCDKVAARMRKQSFAGTTISVYARYTTGLGSTGASKRYTVSLSDGLDIFKNAWSLLEGVRDPHMPIRLLGVSVSGLLPLQAPGSLFPKTEKLAQTLQALDRLEHRYGTGVWSRGATLKTHFKERVSGWHYDHEL